MTNIIEVENKMITLRGQQVILSNYAGHDSEKSESGGDYHRHCRGIRKVDMIVSGNHI